MFVLSWESWFVGGVECGVFFAGGGVEELVIVEFGVVVEFGVAGRGCRGKYSWGSFCLGIKVLGLDGVIGRVIGGSEFGFRFLSV